MRNGFLKLIHTEADSAPEVCGAANDSEFDEDRRRENSSPPAPKLRSHGPLNLVLPSSPCNRPDQDDYWLGGYAGI
jgi:hypothetical protein